MQELFRLIVPQERFIYKTIVMTFFLMIVFLYFKENGKSSWKKMMIIIKQPWLMLYIICTAYLLTCTIIGRYFTTPFNNIFGSFGLFTRNGKINKDMIANIIMFVPYSFLYLKAFKPQNPFRAAMLISFCTTLFVELSQLVGWLGSFQIADIIHNLIGGGVGFVIWYLWEKLFSGK